MRYQKGLVLSQEESDWPVKASLFRVACNPNPTPYLSSLEYILKRRMQF